MKTHRPSHATRIAFFTLPALVALAVGAAPACSTSNPAPPTSGSSTSVSSSSGAGGSSTASSSSSSSSGSGGGGASSSSSGGTGGDAGAPCVSDGGDAGCYSCPPTTTNQFLNACAPGGDQCTHFDNATQLPFWDGGALPAP
jgi:hypothetical protein